MESPNSQTSLCRQDRHMILEQFKRNDEVFRNTMEAIFQKYSNLDDPGLDVCFETMTFKTRKGVVPIHSAEAEEELQHLRSRATAEQSLQVLDSSKDEQMDVTQRTEDDHDSTSSQMGNSDVSLGHGTETSQLSMSSVSASQSCLWWELSQPEEDDEDLERTLNSHNRTLLDIYPSMLNQIGEAYRRRHVTEAANAVLRRYRRQRCQSSQAQRRNHVLSNTLDHTLNETMDSSFAVQKISHDDMTSYPKDWSSYEGVPTSKNSHGVSPLKIIRNACLASSRSSQELSPLMIKRNSSLASIRSNQELSPLMMKRNLSLASIRSSQGLSPLKAIQNSSLAPSSSNQELSPLMTRRNVSLASIRSSQELSPLKAIRTASLAFSSSNQELSPLKAIRTASLASSSSNQELSPLKSIRNSPLASSACFYSPRRAEGPNSPVAESRSRWTSPGLQSNSKAQHQPVRVLDLSTPPSPVYNTELDAMLASAVCSPSQSMCNSPLKRARNGSLAGQGDRSLLASPSRHCPPQTGGFSGALVERERIRDRLYSPIPSPKHAFTTNRSSDARSPLKPRVFSLEQDQQTSSIYSPKQTVPVNRAAALQLYKSPYQSQQGESSSSWRSSSDHQENLAMGEVIQHGTKLPKRQRSFSERQSTSSSISLMSSRQIDAEFRRLYHHFICRGNSSSCPTSSCHLCERQLRKGVQTPPTVYSSVSALALTPVRSRLGKRRRQSDVEESMQLKRFRESCSPKQHSAAVNPSEEKRTWNRALLLQCPSPGFLRASGDTWTGSGSKPGLQNYSHSPFWSETSGSVSAAEAKSPMRAWNQSGVSFPPSVSRRRLLYGPLQ
ncbi:uncharacterized protein [Salminus brasiliensis]|uniref:uncharacterized protein n=1 Tax=Salminus brasiliensis TaxID=930266 RepID=UPI003B82D1D6